MKRILPRKSILAYFVAMVLMLGAITWLMLLEPSVHLLMYWIVFAMVWIMGYYFFYKSRILKRRIEYGEGKILVCDVFYEQGKRKKIEQAEYFDVKDIVRYGYTYELYFNQEGLKYILLGTVNSHAQEKNRLEVMIELKDGQKVSFNHYLFCSKDKNDFAQYIYEEAGVEPFGTLAKEIKINHGVE